MRILAALALLGIAFIADGAIAQSRVDNPPDPYVHRATSFALPARLGNFVRGAITEYDADATDIGANYDLIVDKRSVATITVYVYPPTSMGSAVGEAGCKASYDGAKQAIVGRFADARLVREETSPAPDPDARLSGKHAAFTLRGDFFSPGGRIASEVYVYCPAKAAWHVKYRISTPADTPHRAEIEAFMKTLEWPASLGG